MPAIRMLPTRRSRRLVQLPPSNVPGHEDMELAQFVAASDSTVLRPYHDPNQSSNFIETDRPEILSTPSLVASSATLALEAPEPVHTSSSRKKIQNHIPRPPNAFMCYRSWFWDQKKLEQDCERDHRRISCLAAQSWRELDDAQRAPHRRKAEELKRKHLELYPQYRYAPSSREKKVPEKRKASGSVSAGLEGSSHKRFKPDTETPVSGSEAEIERALLSREVQKSASRGEAMETAAAEHSSPPPVLIRIPAPARSATPKPQRSHKARKTATKPTQPASPVPVLSETQATHTVPVEEPESTDEFVATSQIPKLDLGPPASLEDLATKTYFRGQSAVYESRFQASASGSNLDAFGRSPMRSNPDPSLAELQVSSSPESSDSGYLPSVHSSPSFSEPEQADAVGSPVFRYPWGPDDTEFTKVTVPESISPLQSSYSDSFDDDIFTQYFLIPMDA